MTSRKLSSQGLGILSVGSEYTDEEREFLIAMERYVRKERRRYPSYTEILNVAKALGWRKVAQPTSLPGVPDGQVYVG